MPQYSYRCDKCDLSTTQLRTIADRDKPMPCPSCRRDTKRELQVGGIQFNAGGFYSVDSKKS